MGTAKSETSFAPSSDRKRHCGGDASPIFSKYCIEDDARGQGAMREIPLPDIFDRQAWNARGPLSSRYRYLIFTCTILPALFGSRTRARAVPWLQRGSADQRNRNDAAVSCQDCVGLNVKSVGGHAGLAAGMAFATEYWGEAALHGRGFVSLANMCQRNSLELMGYI